MHIILLTRFHSHHSRSGFVTRLIEESVAQGHKLTVVNPAEVTLHFSPESGNAFPVYWNGTPFPQADLVMPSARWDDAHTWQVAETLQAWNRLVVMHSRVPLGDHVTMARLFARREIPSPRTWVLSQAQQVAILLPELTFPCIMRSRYGGAGRRLVVVQHSGEAYAQAEQLCASGQPFLIQDLPQPVGEDTRVLVIGNRVAAAINRRAPSGFVRPRETANAQVVPVELTPQENKIALSAAQLFGAPFCSVSLLRTPQGPMLLEVARAPTLEEFEGTTGQNLAREIVTHLANFVDQAQSSVVPLARRVE